MQFDLIIVGLGAMGSAALYQATKAGAKVLGIDRYAPPHQLGSSHAETRITRLAVGEGAHYLPYVARSHQIWRELEAETEQPLLFQTGGYVVAPSDSAQTEHSHWNKFVERTAAVAEAGHIPFERQTPADVRSRLPNILLQDDETVGYEPNGGIVLCERAIETQLRLARKLGATIQLNETVTDFQYGAGSVTVTTEHNTFHADKVVIAAGPWLPTFIPNQKQRLTRVTRQVVHWFDVTDPSQFSTDRFPFFLWLGETTADYLAIFPMPPNGIPGLKVMTEQFDVATDPTVVSRDVSQMEIDQFYTQLVSKKLIGVTPNCIQSSVCLYTNTPDEHFIIDHHPESDRVMVISACSGHGFKHSAAIGEAVVQLALAGESTLDLTPFGFDRFGSE